jgi:hypothetical protein
MFYPVFLTCEVNPAILVIGVNFAFLLKVFGGAAVAVLCADFCIGISFATSMRDGGGATLRGAGTALAACNPPVGRGGATLRGGGFFF